MRVSTETAALVLGARLLLGVVFVVAGAAKLTAPGRRRFAEAVGDYDLLPAALVGPVASTVPVLECVAGAMLLLGLLPSVAAWLLAVMLAGFTVAVAVNLLRGRRIACGCGGAATEPITWWTVARNALLTGVAAALALAGPVAPGLTPARVAVAPSDLAAVAIASATLLVLARLGAAALAVRRLPLAGATPSITGAPERNRP
jgi:uncharacterized membrane protein YphA (DoxX/SURF4 family)